MAKVHCYILTRCPFCIATKNLLEEKGIEYKETIVDNNPELRQEAIDRSGRSTVPQIFINDIPIGGFTELQALEKSKKLDEMLEKHGHTH